MIDDSSYDRAGASGITAAEFQFYGPPTVSGTRRIFEAHALGVLRPRAKQLVEVGTGIEDRSVSNGSATTARTPLDPELTRGGAVEVSWMITGEKRVSSVWPALPQGNPFSFKHPAIEVAARGERLDVGRGMRDFAGGGATSGSVGSGSISERFVARNVSGRFCGDCTGTVAVLVS